MGSVSPKMDETPIQDPVADDEEDMTSVMSAEQRKALQQAAKTEKESATLERDTAKPPPSDERPVPIPRAAAVPAELRISEEPRVAPAEPAPKAASRHAPAPSQPAGWTTWELVAFLLLAAAVVAALRS
jgi:hypothetical protein